MYISSAAFTASMRSSILATQNDLATAQKELSSGTYADLGLTLGSSSGDMLALAQQQSRISAYTAGNSVANTRLSSAASTMTSLQSSATSFLQDLTTASTSGGLTTGLQAAASGNLTALIAGLNTTVAGQAVFGGINTAAVPITAYTPTSATKQAVDSAFSTTFGTSQTSAGAASITGDQMTSFLNGSFADLFSASSFSSTWSTASDTTQTTEIAQGQQVTTSVSANAAPFRALAQAYTMVTEFTGSTMSAGAQQAVVTAATALVNQALTGLTDQQASVGIAQSAISDANDQNTAQSTLLTTQASSMQDVDVYSLNTRITSLQTQIEASYELTSQMKQLSLVNYFTA